MISIALLSQWLSAEVADTALLADLEAQAVATVEGETGRYFGPVALTTELLDGNSTRKLKLRESPVATGGPPAVITITVTEIDTQDVETVITDFVLRTTGAAGTANRRAWLERTVPNRWKDRYRYEVTYSHGYAPGAEPEDVRGLVLAEVSKLWANKGGSGEFQSAAIGPWSYTVASGASGGEATDRSRVIERWRGWVYA